MADYKLLHGDCLDKLKELEDNSIDAVVTDPPYGLSFMGKKWDYDVPKQEIWEECMRVLKPGGHLLAFAGSRTYHRMAVRVEDAGFEIRDQIMWLYGSGFPKSHNIGKKLDDWQGWGTALKPAHEPIVMARKPFKGSVANNVLEHGVGGLNIDECRVGSESRTYDLTMTSGNFETTNGGKNIKSGSKTVEGRFPANIILDEEAGKVLDEQSGVSKSGKNKLEKGTGGIWNKGTNLPIGPEYGDTGGASRFFYCPKVSKKERNEGVEGEDKIIKGRDEGQDKTSIAYKARPVGRKNIHPTVKPSALMEYLIRLVTPKGGTVLDPFMGSGSTGKACAREGMKFVGVEMDDEYIEIAKQRVEYEYSKRKFF